MLKVIIVDDEQWSLDYMLNLVDWHKNGAEVVATFTNSMEALAFFGENPDIDLVFIDVQMPEITGLEFLQRSANYSSNAEFVIISSYDYFNYAQTAIRNGAKDYLLKPVEQADVERILKDSAGKSEKGIKESIEKSLIEVIPSNQLQSRAKSVCNCLESQYTVCCVTDAPDSEIKDLFCNALLEKFEMVCYHSVWHHAFFVTMQESDFLRLSGKKIVFDDNYHFGFSVANNDNETVKSMLIKAKSAFDGNFFCPKGRVCIFDDQHEKWSATAIFTVKKYLEDHQIANIHNCIEEFYSEIETRCVQADTGILFYNKIIEFLADETDNSVKSSDHFLIDIQHAKKKFENKDDMILFLQCLVDEWGMEHAGEIQLFKAKDFIPRIQKYINENCQNELNLSLLAKEFMISGKYLSSVFKKTTGMNLNRYINLSRIKKAAVILEQTEVPIQDVSYLCGYSDCSYFTKIFKQLIGLTPSEYRISKRGEDF